MRSAVIYTFLLAFCAGCTLIGSKDTTEIEFTLDPSLQDHARADFRITFNDGWRERNLVQDDFTRIAETQYNAGPFSIAQSGRLHVACALLDEENRQELASVSVVLKLQSDWRFHIDCSAGQQNPYRLCWGCRGYEAQPLGSVNGFESSDSLFIVWAGDSISHPPMY